MQQSWYHIGLCLGIDNDINPGMEDHINLLICLQIIGLTLDYFSIKVDRKWGENTLFIIRV
jgi:hypothetical protein